MEIVFDLSFLFELIVISVGLVVFVDFICFLFIVNDIGVVIVLGVLDDFILLIRVIFFFEVVMLVVDFLFFFCFLY